MKTQQTGSCCGDRGNRLFFFSRRRHLDIQGLSHVRHLVSTSEFCLSQTIQSRELWRSRSDPDLGLPDALRVHVSDTSKRFGSLSRVAAVFLFKGLLGRWDRCFASRDGPCQLHADALEIALHSSGSRSSGAGAWPNVVLCPIPNDFLQVVTFICRDSLFKCCEPASSPR